jgi:hypothetical protein
MPIPNLDQKTKNLLIKSGWSFDRSVDFSKDRGFRTLISQVTLFQSAKSFLESFYKIRIERANHEMWSEVYFDPVTFLSEFDRLEALWGTQLKLTCIERNR